MEIERNHGRIDKGGKMSGKMDAHGASEQHVPGQPVDGTVRQRGRFGIRQTSGQVCAWMAQLVSGRDAATAALVGLYLSAIVAANLIVNHFGPSASIITALVLIGLDLTTRDHLHDAWHGQNLKRNMVLLQVI